MATYKDVLTSRNIYRYISLYIAMAVFVADTGS